MSFQAKYDLNDYDSHLALRPSWLMIASMLFLCRGWLLLLLIGVSNVAGVSVEIDDLVPTDYVWQGLIAGVPSALTLYAWLVRVPTAKAFVRAIWRNGRALLTLAALLHVTLVFAAEWPSLRWLTEPVSALILLGDLWVIAFVLLSRRVKDTFLDFPSR